MKRITQVIAIVTALSAFPALADEGAPATGSSRDGFSQTYVGRETRQQDEARSCERACSRAQHERAKAAATKVDAPQFTDAG